MCGRNEPACKQEGWLHTSEVSVINERNFWHKQLDFYLPPFPLPPTLSHPHSLSLSLSPSLPSILPVSHPCYLSLFLTFQPSPNGWRGGERE